MDKCAITWNDISAAAKELQVEPCAIYAVCRVESLGAGFLKSGKPKILFEGHIFWKRLKKHGLDPQQFAAANPSILYPKWERAHYKGGEAEHGRLEAACAIHRRAALESASWGMFQIMGFNHPACGYDDVEDFVADQCDCAATHLKAFCRLLHLNGWHEKLRNLDWAAFARLYNGPGYAQNQYDKKLAAAYAKCVEECKKRQSAPNAENQADAGCPNKPDSAGRNNAGQTADLGGQLEDILDFLWKK